MTESVSNRFVNTYQVSKIKITTGFTLDGEDVPYPEAIEEPGSTLAVSFLNSYLYGLVKEIITRNSIEKIYIFSNSCIGFFNCFSGAMVTNYIGISFDEEGFNSFKSLLNKNKKSCILCDFSYNDSMISNQDHYSPIIDCMKDGDVLVDISSTTGFVSGSGNVRDCLRSNNFMLDMVLELSGPDLIIDTHNDFQEFSRLRKYLYFVYGVKGRFVEKEYIREVNIYKNDLEFMNDFEKKISGINLSDGIFVEPYSYMGRDNWYSLQKIQQLKCQYHDFGHYRISDLISKIDLNGKLLDVNKYDQINLNLDNPIRLINDCISIDGTADKDLQVQNMHFLDRSVLLYFHFKNNLILSEYLYNFLHGSFGEALLASTFVKKSIKLSNFLSLEIFCPSLKNQLVILKSFKKCDELKNLIRTTYFNIDFDLFLDAGSRINFEKKIDDVYYSIGSLDDFNRIRGNIAKGESQRLEFKQTFGLDIKTNTKQKYIEDSSIKTIAGFLNSTGGNLLCGVTDSGILTGLNDEINLNYKSADAFLLHVKNVVKQRIGTEFYPFVTFRLHDIDSFYVLEFECIESTTPVFVDEVDFYVRTNPATDKLEGRKLHEYILNKFKSQFF